MPYFDEQGNEVDGLLTEDELNKKIEEERTALTEKYEAEKTAASERIGAIEAEKESLEKQIEEVRKGSGRDENTDSSTNIVNLRKKLEETTSLLEEERTTNKTRFQDIENDKVEQEIASVVSGDEELLKKVRHNYKNVLVGMEGKTKEQIQAKVLSALKLSTDNAGGPDPLSVVMGGGSRGAGAGSRAGDSNKGFNDKEVAIGNKLGITDADRAKYGSKLK